MSQVMQQEKLSKFDRFKQLNWFDGILDFLFKLTAKSSELLLAAGVILSTANHFQHGLLFQIPVMQAHHTVLADTAIFKVWAWTQAIGFEASAGVVLAMALDAHRDNDKVKRNTLLFLMAGLALVGTVMLVMAFVEASTGISESSLPAWYGVSMSILRGIVSVAYVTVGRVKNRRFSGISPDVKIAEAENVLQQALSVLERTESSVKSSVARITELSLAEISAQKSSALALVTEQKLAITEHHQGVITELFTEHFADVRQQDILQITELLGNFRQQQVEELRSIAGELRQSILDELYTALEQVERPAEVQQVSMPVIDIDETLRELTMSLNGRFDEATQLLSQHVKSSVESAFKTLVVPTAPARVVSAPAKVAKASSQAVLASEDGFNKAQFIIDQITNSPDIKNVEIIRRAGEIGQTIAAGYVSDVRKNLLPTNTTEPETDPKLTATKVR